MKLRLILITASILVLFTACSDDDANANPQLIVSFVFDAEADRLDNLGNPVLLPAGHAAQDPDFESLGLHFIGLYPDKFTPYENGITVFQTPLTNQGGGSAIDFNEEFFITPQNNKISIPLDGLPSGTYEYFRSSIGFQKYHISYNIKGAELPAGISDDVDVTGTVASFLGFNTYIASYDIVDETVTVNGNRAQGYFGLESYGTIDGYDFSDVTEGNSPQTTVPNPINDTSPVPEGSCVVTGNFPQALIIPDNPTENIHIEVVVSINNSFEWVDENGNGKYEPLLGEQVVDMGTRGVFPRVL